MRNGSASIAAPSARPRRFYSNRAPTSYRQLHRTFGLPRAEEIPAGTSCTKMSQLMNSRPFCVGLASGTLPSARPRSRVSAILQLLTLPSSLESLMRMKRPSRRQLLLGTGAAIVAHSTGSSTADTFSLIAPDEAGFAPDLVFLSQASLKFGQRDVRPRIHPSLDLTPVWFQ